MEDPLFVVRTERGDHILFCRDGVDSVVRSYQIDQCEVEKVGYTVFDLQPPTSLVEQRRIELRRVASNRRYVPIYGTTAALQRIGVSFPASPFA